MGEGYISGLLSRLGMRKVVKIGSTEEDVYDRSRRISWIDLESVSNSKILMVGAGALGNEVAKDLALSGFRKITIVDMDHVVSSNLNRCVFFRPQHARERRKKALVLADGMRALSEHSAPEPIVGKIQEQPPGLFNDHDVVLGCLDNVDARIHANACSYAAGKVYVDGGMDGMIGKVMISKPPSGACLQCGMNSTHAKLAGLRFSCTGKDVVFHEPKLAAEITTTSIISAVMVREALKVASGRSDLLLNNAFYYDGERNVSEELEISLDPGCPVHVLRSSHYR
jgi:molybdopterin/thiamine biosynthesis adenylyltransferase